MKKFFTLMLALGALGASASAQSLRVEKKDVFPVRDNHSVYDNSDRSRKETIERINREYDFKIMSVQRNRYMRAKEKKREIKRLERERDLKIREASQRFHRF